MNSNKLNRRQFAGAFAASAAAMGFGARPLRAQGPIVIKFSHVVAADAPKGKAALKFKELAEKATNGAVRVEVYANSTLYKDKEEVEALQLGTVHLLAPSIAKFGPLGVKEFDVFDLPFLFSNAEKADKLFQSPVMNELNTKMEAAGVRPLAYLNNGNHVYTCNKPLINPDDFQGLKLRIQGSKVQDASTRALGAIPQILGFGELYQALQTGVVDGEDNVPSNILTQKFYEVQKYMTISNHGRLHYSLITGKKFWDGLPADIRAKLDDVVMETKEYFEKTAAQDNIDAIEKIKSFGKTQVHVLTPDQRKAWLAKLMPVHKDMEKRFSKEFIEKIQAAAGFSPVT